MKMKMKVDPRIQQKFKVRNFEYDSKVEGSEEFTESVILYKELPHIEVTRVLHSHLDKGMLTPEAGEEISDKLLHKLITGWEGFEVDDEEGKTIPLIFADDLISFLPMNIRLDFIDQVISPMTASFFKLPDVEDTEGDEIKNS